MSDILGCNKRPQGTYDALLELKPAGELAATTASTKYLDIGTGLFKGKALIDVASIEAASDGNYVIIIQGSNDTAFNTAKTVELAEMSIGSAGVKRSNARLADTEGRYKLYFDNERDGEYYRYIRIYTCVLGTSNKKINYSAYVVPME